MNFLLYFNIIMSAVFSLLLVVQNFTVKSVIAMILGLAFSSGFAFFGIKLVRVGTRKSWSFTRSFLSYMAIFLMVIFIVSRAYVQNTPYIMDMILAILWFIIVVTTIVSNWSLSEKRVLKYFHNVQLAHEKQKFSLKTELLGWLDAIIWAIGVIALCNVFIFQLYLIPSESMVPTFMIGDRVVGLKLFSGPQFPVSNFRLPRLHNYKRGDVVIIRSPRYADTPQAELKTLTSQIIYMLSFMQVNTNIDPNTGKPKIDPLVKRIVGLPGEKLMMVDGVLYAKTKDDIEYKPVSEDKSFARWNLEMLSQSELKYVKNVVVGTELYSRIESIEAIRKNVDFRIEYDEIEKIVQNIKQLKNRPDTFGENNPFLDSSQYLAIDYFSNNAEIASNIMTMDGGLTWLENFLTGWAKYWVSANAENESLYNLRNAQLNVLMKKCFAKLILRNAQLISENASMDDFNSDVTRHNLMNEAMGYMMYLDISDGRNMPEFPSEKDTYIPQNEYFMMGDNRFNSLDLRHKKDRLVALDNYDTMPLTYNSKVDPQSLPERKILGTASFILWPVSRFGRVQK